MSIRVLAMIVGFMSSFQAIAAGLCEVSIDKSNPRRFDMQFPNKVITVVGHLHPQRRTADGSPAMENYLRELFSLPLSQNLNKSKVKATIDRYVRENKGALENWREDREILETALREGTHRAFAIEYPQDLTAQLDRFRAIYLANGRTAAKSLGYHDAEIEQLLTTAMTPAVFTKATNPKLFSPAKIISAEPSESEIEQYEKSHCRRTRGSEAALKAKKDAAYHRLFQRQWARGVSKEAWEAKVAIAVERWNQIMWQAARSNPERLWKFDTEGAISHYAKNLDVELSEENRADLAIWADLSRTGIVELQVIDAAVPAEERIRDLTQRIEQYSECSGRNTLMARNLAKQEESTMLFVGVLHLYAQAALLKRECNRQLRQTPNSNSIEFSNLIR